MNLDERKAGLPMNKQWYFAGAAALCSLLLLSCGQLPAAGSAETAGGTAAAAVSQASGPASTGTEKAASAAASGASAGTKGVGVRTGKTGPAAAGDDAALTKSLQDTYWIMEKDTDAGSDGGGRFCDLLLRQDGTGRFRTCDGGRFGVDASAYWIDIVWSAANGKLEVRGSDTDDAFDCTVGQDRISFRYSGKKNYVLYRADMPEEGSNAIPCELAGAWFLTSYREGDYREGSMENVSSELDFYGGMEADVRWENSGAEAADAERTDADEAVPSAVSETGLQVQIDSDTPLYEGCANRSWSAELTGSAEGYAYYVTLVGDELQLLRIDDAGGEDSGSSSHVFACYERNSPYGWENSEIGEEDDCDTEDAGDTEDEGVTGDAGETADLSDFQVFLPDDWAGHYKVVQHGSGNDSSVAFNFSPEENNVPLTVFRIHRYTSDSYRDEMDMIGDNPKELGKHGKYWYVASTPFDFAGGYYSQDENSLYREMSEFYTVLEDHILFTAD